MLPNIKPFKKTIYLDHAATTYLDSQVKKAMEPFWGECFGNPSSLYSKGREAKKAIEKSRKIVASLISARPEEIIFTAGGTESINLAVFGAARQFETAQKRKGHIISSVIEHHAVLYPIEHLVGEGWKASFIKVDGQGFIKFDELKAAVRPETALISVMYANNEIGTIQPMVEAGKWLKNLNQYRLAKNLPKILFHTDACQAAGACDVNVQRLGVDLMTINGSKIYGPKQIGFLYVRSGTLLGPLIYGGGQERGLRSGTENVPGVVGLAKAFELVQKQRIKENGRLRKLRDYFIGRIFETIPKIKLNGPIEQPAKKTRGREFSLQSFDKQMKRLPNNINFSIPGIEGESMVLYLDAYGICASSSSACDAPTNDPSHVLMAIGRSLKEAHGSVRFTLGKKTTKKDIDYVMKILPPIVKELRKVNL